MTDPEQFHSTAGDQESPLAELLEQITRKLQQGEPFEPDDYLKRYPSFAGPLRDLLPTLHDLSKLGRSITIHPSTKIAASQDEPS